MSSSPICRSENDTLNTGTLFFLLFLSFANWLHQLPLRNDDYGLFRKQQVLNISVAVKTNICHIISNDKTDSTPINFLLRKYTGATFKRREKQQQITSRTLMVSIGYFHIFSLSSIQFLTIFTPIPPTRSTHVQMLWIPRKILLRDK